MRNWIIAWLGRVRAEAGTMVVRGRSPRLVVLPFLLWACVGCAVGDDTVGLSGLLYNYDEHGISSVRVDGKGVSGWADGARRGAVTGGGQACCFRLRRGAREVPVSIRYFDGNEIDLVAEIEQPWPPMTSLGIVHVLPGADGPKVIIEITPGQRFPRSDLMTQALAAAGLDLEIDYEGPLRSGPFTYSDD